MGDFPLHVAGAAGDGGGMPPPETTVPPSFTLRPAEVRDVGVIVALIRELAEFEKLSHQVEVTPERLGPQLFGPEPAARALVAEVDGTVEGFALYFFNFSTFLGRPGLYLEDLYVRPAHRRRGVGRGLLRRLAAIAVERGCGRFEWSVLDWNAGAIRFYEGLGATVLPDWRICRVTGEGLRRLGGVPLSDAGEARCGRGR
jgi:GNAT superfamily N-acetyltransferase